MNKILLGDTFDFAFELQTNSQSTSLSGRDISVILICPNGKKEQVTYTTEGTNTIVFRYQGVSQSCLGTYSIDIYENYGKSNQHRANILNAFALVKTAKEVSYD